MRDEFLHLLQKSVASLHSMLDDVMDLARLQAGHELRDLKTFDVGAMLKDLYEHMRHFATERGLYLNADGPDALTIQGDAVKIRRIAQNLLINALKYTYGGGVKLRWGDSGKDDPERWVLHVEDTGPGFHAGPGAPLVGALEAATREANAVDSNVGKAKAASDMEVPPPPVHAPSDLRPIHQEHGEGIGLSIVKRLCELLDASVEIESKPGRGTTFRVVLPRHYESV
jgi:signal transduction histidine kinase